MALTADSLIAALNAAGADDPTALATSLVGAKLLVDGLAALGVNSPETMTAFLTAAARLVQRERLTAQIAALQAAQLAAAQTAEQQKQALQQKINDIQQQIGA